MKRRGFCVCSALIAAGSIMFCVGGSRRPILYIVHSVSCSPCRAFDQDWLKDSQFKAALQRAFDCRSLAWEDLKARDIAKRLGVTTLPAFVVQLPDGRFQAPLVGYLANLPPADRKADLLQRLGVPWPRGDLPEASDVQEVAPLPPAARVTEPPDNSQLRDIEKTQRRIGEEIGDLSSGVNAANSAARDAAQAVEVLRQEIAAARAAAAAQAAEAAQRKHDSTKATPQTDQTDQETAGSAGSTPPRPKPPAEGATPADAAEPPPLDHETRPAPPATLPDPGGVVGGLLGVGVGAAAMYFGLPAGAGALAASGVTWLVMRRRRRHAEHGHTTAPSRAHRNGDDWPTVTNVDNRGPVTTRTKFVVSEVDVVGEAYREAVRRVANEYRERSPRVADACNTIDQIAKHIEHGRRIQRRPKTEPGAEDPPEHFTKG